MSGFRGSDDQLDREIATLERIARLRVRRTAEELKELDRDLHDLRQERRKRRATSEVPEKATATAEAPD